MTSSTLIRATRPAFLCASAKNKYIMRNKLAYYPIVIRLGSSTGQVCLFWLKNCNQTLSRGMTRNRTITNQQSTSWDPVHFLHIYWQRSSPFPRERRISCRKQRPVERVENLNSLNGDISCIWASPTPGTLINHPPTNYGAAASMSAMGQNGQWCATNRHRINQPSRKTLQRWAWDRPIGRFGVLANGLSVY